MSNSSHTYGTAKALTSNSFTRTGYSFAGWNTKADGTGTSYTDGQSVKSLTSTNGGTVNLYAQWAKTVTIAEGGYATVFADANLKVPASGVEVWGFTYANGALTQIAIAAGAILPANHGYLVKADTAGDYKFTVTSSAATATESVLTGSMTDITTPDGEVYVWGKPDGYGYGFYKYTGETISAGKAYYIKTN